MNSIPAAKSLQSTGDVLVITWDDGVVHRLPWSTLRRACPCATCRTLRTQSAEALPIIEPGTTGPIRPTAMTAMGNYAYHISFSDGHNTGIYSLEYLRALGEAADEARAV